MADVKSGDVVVPGDQLCVIEEMTPGYGTYERDGVVYAATFGQCLLDIKNRSIKIVNPDGSLQLALPEKGDILVGKVTRAFDSRAEVSIVKRNGKDTSSPILGEIRINNVTRRFVKSMLDVLRSGDVVRGVALNTHDIPVQLSLVGPELGVILGTCVRCGHDLLLTTRNNMICLRCENRETREVTNDYGNSFGLEVRVDLAPRRRSYDDRRDSRGPRRYESRGSGRRGGRSDDRRGGDRRGSFRDRERGRR
ncbi:MAG: exosome complex RNA-binding protein Csl4 [Candidatus Thorarchaeota archaeon]